MAHVSESKKKTVDEFSKLISEYPIIASVDLENLPAPQLQNMRETLRDKVVLRMTKRRLINIAIDKAKDKKPGLEKLKEKLKGMPALLFTKENPFSLYKTIKKNKSAAPAKAGQIAPKDIVVPAGPTGFMPGPVIGELGALGIKSSVENGKIAIKEDAIVAKEGEVISPELAAMLTRLGITPMEVGLDIVAAYEDGTIYTRKVLDIDEDQFMADLTAASQWAFNLAIESGYTTKETIGVFITKAFNQSKAVAIESGFMADAVVGDILGKAEREMLSLKKAANIQ